MIIIDMSEYLVFGHRRHSTGSNQLQFIVCDSSSVKIDIKVSARTCLLFRSSCTLSLAPFYIARMIIILLGWWVVWCARKCCVLFIFFAHCSAENCNNEKWYVVSCHDRELRRSKKHKNSTLGIVVFFAAEKKDEKKRKTQRDAMIIAYFSTSKADLLPCSLQPTHNDEAELLIKNHWL